MKGLIALGSLVVLAAAATVASQGPHVLDINQVTAPDPPSYPGSAAQIGAWTYFLADAGSGYELHRTMGTPATTELVVEIGPGSAGLVTVGGAGLEAVGTTLFLGANDGVHGYELWKSDGTAAGTMLVEDIRPGPESASLDAFMAVGSTLYFQANDGVHGSELWCSDGTASGTALVADLRPGTSSSLAEPLIEFGGKLLFLANDGVHGRELWISDGTAAGTKMVKDIAPGSGSGMLAIAASRIALLRSDVVLFEAYTGLWRSDGTESGTFLVKDLETWGSFATVGSVMFFAGDDGVHGSELWRSDGTAAGTYMVRDITPGVWGSSPSGVFDFNGTAIFAAGTEPSSPYFTNTDIELWRSDGTESGTVRIADLLPGTASSSPGSFVMVAGQVLFTTWQKLWRTDGTESGTVLVKTLPSIHMRLANATGYALLSADDGVTGAEPWVSDGTPAGTTLLANLNPPGPTADADPAELVDLFGVTLFVADDGIHGRELWRSDGTAAGTWMVADLHPGSAGSIRAGSLIRVGGSVFFAGSTGSGYDLWKSDGTAAGTVRVAVIRHGSGASVDDLVAVGDSVFFGADDGVTGKELWKSDGTAAGTMLVRDIVPGPASSNPTRMEAFRDLVVFSADTGDREPWRSDGTVAGTFSLATAWPGGIASPLTPAAAGDAVYFSAESQAEGREPWRTDGTTEGTWLVADISPGLGSSNPKGFFEVGGLVFFTAADPVHGAELWRTQGTASTTSLVRDIEENGHSIPSWFTALGGKLLFSASEPAAGRELWESDGTHDGTVLVADINPLGRSSDPAWLETVGTRSVYCAADDGRTGEEPWVTDGTAAGTRQIGDLDPGLFSSEPRGFTLSGGRLLFVARHPTKGNELWVYDPGATAQQVGTPCPPRYLALRATDPVLGQDLELVVDGAQPGAPGAVLLGAPSDPLALPGAGCPLYLSPPTAAVLLPFTAPSSTWSSAVRIPDITALQGVMIALQAVNGFTLPVDASNGVVATLGR